MEVTQFTYFQQVGGIPCHPVTAEITYGLERIAMYMQNVDRIHDLVWVNDIKYSDVHLQAEIEQSKYYLDEASIDLQYKLFDMYEAEAKRLLDLGLAFPGYDHVLKCSHAFNILQARGAISVTDRQS